MVFTVVDIETTGISRHYHKITEIAAAKIRKGKISKTYQTLVNPEVKIPLFITRLTGIDNDMVKDAKTIDEALPSFVKFLGKNVFVAHNATFDFRFLEHNLNVYHNHALSNDRLCTRKLANRLIPSISRKRLSDLCEFFNIKNEQAHRALGDVHATSKVLANMLEILKEKGISKLKDILKFESSPIRKDR